MSGRCLVRARNGSDGAVAEGGASRHDQALRRASFGPSAVFGAPVVGVGSRDVGELPCPGVRAVRGLGHQALRAREPDLGEKRGGQDRPLLEAIRLYGSVDPVGSSKIFCVLGMRWPRPYVGPFPTMQSRRGAKVHLESRLFSMGAGAR